MLIFQKYSLHAKPTGLRIRRSFQFTNFNMLLGKAWSSSGGVPRNNTGATHVITRTRQLRSR